MAGDRAVGAAMAAGALAGLVVYAYLLFGAGEEVALLVLKLTALGLVGAVAAVVAWIGYTIATTPPPRELEEVEREIEEELKRLEGGRGG